MCPGKGKCKSMKGNKHMLNIGNGNPHYTPYMISVDAKHTVPKRLIQKLLR
jgi:hypothetical protein